MILTTLHPPGTQPAPQGQTQRPSATLELVRALYPGAPHATLCMPFCKQKQALARSHYLASTDGRHLCAVVAYTREAIEFTWCLPGRRETLRNLIVQVAHRLPALAFLPVIESSRRDWDGWSGLASRGSFFRALLGSGRYRRRALPGGFEVVPCDPARDLPAAAELLASCAPEVSGRIGEPQLEAMTRADYFLPDGWLFLRDRVRGDLAGLAISGLCREFGEGFVDWIQILPAYRGRGLGTALLGEALERLREASFVTVSGSLESLHAGELFERCGFRQMRRWTILARP